MPSEIMDRRGLSSMYVPQSLSEEIYFPIERQVGFWKSEATPSHHGNESDASSLLEKIHSVRGTSVEYLELPPSYISIDKKTKLNMENHLLDSERRSNLSMTKAKDQNLGSESSLCMQPVYLERSKVELNGTHYENSLFSSSLSEIFTKKLRLASNGVLFGQSVNLVTPHLEEGPFESLKEVEAQTIGNLLPDDDDLFSGMLDELEYIAKPTTEDDFEEFDLFSSGGGLELEAADSLNGYGFNNSSEFLRGISNGPNCPFAGEHPSRTLFVRNINSIVEDFELRALFEQYGDIRNLYTACKHRGFIIISYYDIRAARNAMRALQNKPLKQKKLNIHFSIPKGNPSEKDINQGTLVVFNLDSSVSNDDLRQIFGVYGEIKEIRETPHKRHHKFIEFYDVRGAEAALRALNRSDIAGKRIKLEASRPGGARRCSIQQFSPELDQEEGGGCQQQGGPPSNSPSGFYRASPHETITSNCLNNGVIHGFHSSIRAPISSCTENGFHGISSSVPHSLPSPVRVASAGSHGNRFGFGENSHSLGQTNLGFRSMPTFHPHSLPDYHEDVTNGGTPFDPIDTISASMNSRPIDGNNQHVHQVGSSGLERSFEPNEGVFGASGNGGLQYAWGNTDSYNLNHTSHMMWPNLQSFVNGVHAHSPHQLHGLTRAPSHMINTALPLPRHHHHVGSAPAVNPSLWEQRHSYAGDTAEASSFLPGSLGCMGFYGSSNLHPEFASHSMFPWVGGNCIDPSFSPLSVRMSSPQQRANMFPGMNPMISMTNSFDGSIEHRLRSRRGELNSNQADNKKLYELDIDRIICGEDTRTTLMIKNIPNKYTSKMLLAAIDERHRGTYDFIYLPIDFKNKCNVGYAFINMIDPMHIIPFYQAFNGKKWEKFNSEKVASLAYARIQGKAALVAHFQNSSLMNEDKRCRPVLFHSNGPNAGDQEPFPMGSNIRSRSGKTRPSSNEEARREDLSASLSGEESSSGSSKDSD